MLGLLVNYNKFEFQNPYRLRLGDFVNEGTIGKIIHGIGRTCSFIRDAYVAVQDDSPEDWSLNGTLTYLGLGSLGFGKKPNPRVLDEEAANAKFGSLSVSRMARAERSLTTNAIEPDLPTTLQSSYQRTTLLTLISCSARVSSHYRHHHLLLLPTRNLSLPLLLICR